MYEKGRTIDAVYQFSSRNHKYDVVNSSLPGLLVKASFCLDTVKRPGWKHKQVSHILKKGIDTFDFDFRISINLQNDT